MSDSFSETTSTSWFSRIGSSFKALLISPLVMAGSAVLLFWNEGNSVYTAAALAEGKGVMVDVAPPVTKLDAASQGKLVHLEGDAKTDEMLEDADFGLKLNAIHLSRKVEMYQWDEEEKSEEKKKLGGGTETVKTYTYEKKWSTSPIDSGRFKKPEGHENPGAFPIEAKTVSATKVDVGAYRLSGSLIDLMSRSEKLTLDPEAVKGSPWVKDRKDAKTSASEVYLGDGQGSPKVGDVRITFSEVKPAAVSILAQLNADGALGVWKAKNDYTIQRLEYGSMSAADMITKMETENVALTWILRAVGFVIMAIGVGMIFQPLSVLADVIPMLGDFVSWGTGLFAFVIAASLSMFVIAVAWLYYRPLYAIALIVAGIALIVVVRMLLSKPRPRPEPSLA